MNKSFRTYKQQIEGLKDKGLQIEDELDAVSFLQAENYYTVINGYKEPFECKDGTYIEGTKFTHIQQLFLFNRDLRSILLRYSLIIENAIKSIIAYEFEKNHRSPNAYLNVGSYNCNKDLDGINKQIEIINKIINEKKSYEGPIRHYLSNYDSLPLWVLVKYMTIGNISYFYSYLDNSTRNNVAKAFSDRFKKQYTCSNKVFFSAEDLRAAIKAINLIRNICAHGERVYNIKFSRIRSKSLRNLIGVNFSNDSLVLIFGLFKFFLTQEYYIEFISFVKLAFDKYFPLFDDKVDTYIMECMGFTQQTFKELLF